MVLMLLPNLENCSFHSHSLPFATLQTLRNPYRIIHVCGRQMPVPVQTSLLRLSVAWQLSFQDIRWLGINRPCASIRKDIKYACPIHWVMLSVSFDFICLHNHIHYNSKCEYYNIFLWFFSYFYGYIRISGQSSMVWVGFSSYYIYSNCREDIFSPLLQKTGSESSGDKPR